MQINLIIKTKTWQRFALTASALVFCSVSIASNAIFDQPDSSFSGMLNASGVVYPGDKAEITGRGFKAGQQVQLVRNGHVLTGKTPLVANDEGQIKTTIEIPSDAAIGLHPIVAQVMNPSAATVFDLKVSPHLELLATDAYTLNSAAIAPGLYQTAYSPKNKVLFVTSAVGRPPVKTSQISKVDPKTLKVIASVQPPVDSARDEQVMAVYGIAVDDQNNNIWVTNTRAGTVSVYGQEKLNLIKQFPHGSAVHGRDVVVDEKLNKAFVSSPTSNQLYVFDTATLEALEPITLPSSTRQDFTAMSLSYDKQAQKLYTVSRTTNELAIIDTQNTQVEKTIALPGMKNLSGVSIAPSLQRVFITGQSTDNVAVYDLKSGEVIKTILVGAGPLNVLWDEKTKAAYITNRGSDTVAILNGDGELIANLASGSFPNHIVTDNEGDLFLVNKARGQDDSSADQLTRITRN